MTAGRVTRIEIMPLPRWARMALAARCLRRARRLIHPRPEQSAILDSAIARIEEAAATGQPNESLAELAAAAYRLALDNLDTPIVDKEGEPHDEATAGDRDVSTCMVAHAAAFAAEAASMTDAHQAARLVAQSVDFVVHACRLSGTEETNQELEAMRADLELLWAAEPTWDDTTPVPPAFFEGSGG